MKFSLGRAALKAAKPYLNARHWWFYCFVPDRAEKLTAMLAELARASDRGLRLVHAHAPGMPAEEGVPAPDGRPDGERLEVVHVHFPPGVALTGEECHAYFVPKSQLGQSALEAGMRRHFGHGLSDADEDVFVFGLTPEAGFNLYEDGLRRALRLWLRR
jgi:hypothetical protein